MKEIRFHGRGGQGAVTSAELVALAAINEGKYAQAFPSFGPERRGAPVLAFSRVADAPIRLRSQIYEPDVVLVLDPSLIDVVDVTAGLKQAGTVVVNTTMTFDALAEKLNIKGKNATIAAVDATSIARKHLGRPITNTTMLGALIRATGLVTIDSMSGPLRTRFGLLASRNEEAMRTAFQETAVKEIHP